jgi:hypothetical protein
MEQEAILKRGGLLVKELSEGMNHEGLDLQRVEERILRFVYELAGQMEQEIIAGLEEPTSENSVVVGDRVAVYSGERNLRYRNRFGGTTVIPRRCYKYRDGSGGWSPLDEKLGLDRCLGYSPLMSYLLTSFGASEPYGHGAELLAEALGFPVSATAVQRNTEAAGEGLPENPYQQIESHRQQERCQLMVVEVDGTISAQIEEQQGVSGRESLKAPTEWKECNVAVIEKHFSGKRSVERWTGGRYGKFCEFDPYVGRAGMAMGQHHAKRIAFIADGAPKNWELQKTNFPMAIQILDFYHASEHLAAFCELLPEGKEAARRYRRWREMLLEGQAIQMITELRRWAERTSDRTEAIREIEYFKSNLPRMDYDRYRDEGLPLGSGLVEGSCKFLVGKRFKGNGMRWKRADNTRVLKARLAKINGTLQRHFAPRPQKWVPKSLAA